MARKLVSMLIVTIFLMVQCVYGVGRYNVPITKVPYSFLGNYFGYQGMPPSNFTGKRPAIIYVYDEYYDKVGADISVKMGYDLFRFVEFFSSKGYVTLAPLGLRQNVNSVKGAILYLKNHPMVDPDNIHIVGHSEGAFASLMALKHMPPVRSVTMIAPIVIDDTKANSLPELVRSIDMVSSPILILNAARDKGWKLNQRKLMVRILEEYGKNLTIKDFEVDRRWFWNPRNSYMTSIFHFINLLDYQPSEDNEGPESLPSSPVLSYQRGDTLLQGVLL